MLEALRIKYGKHGAAGKRVKVASYIQFYAETFKKPQVRENTWLNYESLLKHVQRTFADMCFQDLTVTALTAHVRATPHALRHTHATQLFLSGWSAKDVQVRLGHSSVAMTLDTYTHYFAQRGKKWSQHLMSCFQMKKCAFYVSNTKKF